jgi:hypothetical protein
VIQTLFILGALTLMLAFALDQQGERDQARKAAGLTGIAWAAAAILLILRVLTELASFLLRHASKAM